MPPDQPQGTPAQTGQGEGDAPKYVTDEQLNRAITARFKDLERKFEKSSEGLGTSLLTKLEEMFAAKNADVPKTDEKQPKTAADSPEMKAMQKQLADMQKLLEKEKSEKEASTLRARDKDLRQKLTESLTASGITGSALKGAIATLVDGDKRVRFDDEGERMLFRGDDGDELPFVDGMKSWLKSDDAKIYLPPRGAAGSGHQPGGGVPRQGQGNEPGAQAKELLFRHLVGGGV